MWTRCATSCATTYSANAGGACTSRQLTRMRPCAEQLPQRERAAESPTDGTSTPSCGAKRCAPQLGVDVPSVGLSAARSRWGSCSAQGRILVNWRLVQAPPAFAEYVVAHEVAHLVHMNHSAAFWRTVGALVPDWRERRVRLRREAHRFLLL